MDTKLRFLIEADNSGMMRATKLSAEELKKLGNETDKVSKVSTSASQSIASSFSSVAKGIIAVGGAIAAAKIAHTIYDIGKASVQMAMEVIESENLFEVSMKNMAKEARTWSQELSKTLGLNQYELRRNIGTFNVMFSSMGLGTKAAYDMSAGLTELANDMASFYNLKPVEAFDKLRAGITGETEPLKRLGILVDEATTKAYAYKAGIADVGEELTQQQKLLARYGSIMEQTSDAQGDLARTADSPANALRRLQTRTEELQAQIGLGLIPTLQEVVAMLDDFVASTQNGLSPIQTFATYLSTPLLLILDIGKGFAEASLKMNTFYYEMEQFNPFASEETLKKLRDNIYDAVVSIGEFDQRMQNIYQHIYDLDKLSADRNKKGPIEKVGDDATATAEALKKLNAELDKAYKSGLSIQGKEDNLWRDTLEMLGLEKEFGEDLVKNLEDQNKEQSKILDKESERLKNQNDFGESTEFYLSTLERIPDILDEQNKAYRDMIESVSDGAGEIFDAMVSRGKGAFQSLKDWIEGIFLSQLRRIFQNFMVGLTTGDLSINSILGRSAGTPGAFGNVFGGAGGIWGGIKNVGGFLGIGGGSTTVGGTPGGTSTLSGTVGGGGGGFNWAGLLSLASFAPFIIQGIGALVDWANGKNSYEAGAMEISRDFGGLRMGEDQLQAWLDSVGISESEAYPIRKDIFSSPRFLSEVLGPLAEQQGRMDEFLKSLEAIETNWGTFNFREAFELGQVTGDWDELNRQFEDAFLNVNNLLDGMEDTLLVGGNVNELLDTFRGFRDAIDNSIIDPTQTMIDTFLETGRITDNLRLQIEQLGGDISAFEEMSGIQQLNNYFEEMVNHFRATGEILPDLRRMIEEYGGSLAAIDSAAQLPDLMNQMSLINRLSSGLSSIAQQFDPVNMLLSGQWNSNIEAALRDAGLDPAKFSNLSSLISAQSNWSSITQNATAGGRVSSDVLNMLSQYGGSAGQLAVERYGQGFNTITASLLEQTKAAMDAAYSDEIKLAMDHLAEVGNETTTEIQDLTAIVESELDMTRLGLQNALNEAREAVVTVLNDILMAIHYQGSDYAPSQGYTPTTPTGATGTTGNEDATGRAATTQIIIQGPIYGFADFNEAVRQAQIEIKRNY